MSEGHVPSGCTSPPYLGYSVWSKGGQPEEAPRMPHSCFQRGGRGSYGSLPLWVNCKELPGASSSGWHRKSRTLEFHGLGYMHLLALGSQTWGPNPHFLKPTTVPTWHTIGAPQATAATGAVLITTRNKAAGRRAVQASAV